MNLTSNTNNKMGINNKNLSSKQTESRRHGTLTIQKNIQDRHISIKRYLFQNINRITKARVLIHGNGALLSRKHRLFHISVLFLFQDT